MERNRPTPEGRALGVEIARLCDQEEAKQARMLAPTIPERCKTCAFRGGTFPNGCGGTLLDALHCIADGHDFLCHEHGRKGQLCAGYQMMRFEHPFAIGTDWPWFTQDAEPNTRLPAERDESNVKDVEQ